MNTKPIYKTPASQDVLLQRYDELLAHWPVPAEKLEVDTAFGRTFALAWGKSQNPPLVLLHGSMANSAVWAGDAAVYARDFRVYAVDIPGEPGRSEPIRMHLAGPAPAQWLNRVLDGLGVTDAHVLGMSLGGLFALQFASASPQRVKKLVLVCPAGVSAQRISFLWHVIKLALFDSKRSDGTIRLIYRNADIPEEAIAYIKLISDHFNPVLSVPVLPERILARVSAPTLFIGGDEDVLLDSAKTIQRLKKFLPAFEPVLLPGVGHAVLDQADRVIAFLQK